MSVPMSELSEPSPPLPRAVWWFVALGVLLVVARGAAWEHRHDEGTTFDLAIGMILRDKFVDTFPANPVPIESLYKVIDGRSDYDAADAIASVGLPYRMFHPPGYYAALHLWTKVFGTGKLVLRIPAYLLAALAILGMALIARRVIPERGAAVWVAAFFAVCPWVISVFNFARPYHLALFLAVWSTVAVLEMSRDGPRMRWRILFVATSLLGIYTLYHYAFVLLWQMIFLLCSAWGTGPARRKREILGLVGCGAVIAAGFVPWLRVFRVHLRASGNSGDYFTGGLPDLPEGHAQFRTLFAFRDYALADSVDTLGGRGLILMVSILGGLTLLAVLWGALGPARKALSGPAMRQARIFWITAPALPLLIWLSDLWRSSHTVLITKICFGFIILLVLATVRAWLCAPRVLRVLGLTAWVTTMGLATLLCTYDRALTTSGAEATAQLIAQADTDQHLLVFSTGLRGYSVPMLLSLRDAGVKNVYVTRATEKQLGGMLAAVASQPMFRRVSLVNFMIPNQSGTLMWDLDLVKNLAIKMRKDKNTWVPLHDADEPWIGIPPLDGVTRKGRFRECWFLQPVRMRFFHGTF
jgi:hypothetical protein